MRTFLLLFLFVCITFSVDAKVKPAIYGINMLADSPQISDPGMKFADSMLASNSLVASQRIYADIEKTHDPNWQTIDFYLIVFLCLILGTIRVIDVKYFNSLWKVLINPTLSIGSIKEQIQNAGLPNLLMNIFFTFSFGTYLYYVVKCFTPSHQGNTPQAVLIAMLILGTGAIYISKYIAIKFSGWAFRVEGITEQYLFNVFLINKIIGIILIPFILVIAFGDPLWKQPVLIISFIVTGLLFLARYLRSWQVFGTFLQFSKFHFFLYLCASELLPLAVLIKFLVNGLMF